MEIAAKYYRTNPKSFIANSEGLPKSYNIKHASFIAIEMNEKLGFLWPINLIWWSI